MPSLNTGNAILSNAIAVDSSYNVGIGGAASGTNKLQVTGIASANSFIPTSSTIPSNGMYLSAANTLNFATNTTNRLTISSSGIVGIAATPSAWGDFKVLEFANGIYLGTYTPAGQTMYLGANNYFNGSDFIYKVSGYATRYQQASGAHQWFVSTISGTAGNVASFNQAMTITSAGNVGIGANPSSFGGYLNTTLQATGASGVNLDFRTSGGTREGVLLLSSGTEFSLIAATAIPLTFRTSDTERMRITSGGNVGIGTSSPTALLHLGVANAAVDGTKGVKITNPAGTTVMLECGVSSDSFVGTTSASDFSIRTGNSERMRIISSGIILIGKTTTSLNTTAGTRIDTNGVSYWQIPNNEETLYVWDSSNQTYRFKVNGSGTVFATNTTISSISDERLKENIKDLDVGLDAIMALRPRKYDWKVQSGNSGKNVRGFIAQEVETIFPDLIDEWKNKDDNENAITYKSLRQDFIPILVKAIQELNQKVENQQQTINSLINR